MAVRIKLDDGREFLLDATLDKWSSAFRDATTRNAMIEIELPDGSIMPVDPRSIESFREESEAEVPQEAEHREAAPAAG